MTHLLALGLAINAAALAPASEPQRAAAPCAGAADAFFVDEVWAKVAGRSCLTCHRKGGDAEESKLLLLDPRKAADAVLRDAAIRRNAAAFASAATLKSGGRPRLLQKVVGGLDHGGKDVLKPDSPEYRILAEMVRRLDGGGSASATPVVDPKAPPFFRGVTMLDDRRLLRRATLSLAGRLPTDAELATVAQGGLKALPAVLDAVMKEDAFYQRLREGFNDVFLLLGIDGNADTSVLSYEHFEKTRLWYQNPALSHLKDIKDARARERAGWALSAEYRKAILGESMALIEYIVRNNRPFTEIVTADYIMVSPLSARGYGVYDEVKGRFRNSGDAFEYVPVRLKALVSRDRHSAEANMDSDTGFYPHAGLLSTFQYLSRYPTTETNRNRLRARMYYLHFLGVDVLELAARVSDAAAATAKFKVPTMQAPECVVCHRTLDPAAGLFQDYWRFDANFSIYGRRKGGWFTDMFSAGFEGETLPAKDRWRALQWLGERTAKDPRFAAAMTGHVYYILTGRKVLQPPKALDDPHYSARARAYAEQRKRIDAIAARFASEGFNLKAVFREWILSEFYRADGLAEAAGGDSCRRSELEDLGLVRMLSPEQLERKVRAVFGEKWGRLEGDLALLYGGIDSKEVTERAVDPSGAMGAIQRSMSNEVACRHVAKDFALPAKDRRLFPAVEPDVLPGRSAADDARIRTAIVHLHQKILGRNDAADSAEADRTFRLFAAVVADAAKAKGMEKEEIYCCRPAKNKDAPGARVADPHYTIRAWRAVVTYLLRRSEFLYE